MDKLTDFKRQEKEMQQHMDRLCKERPEKFQKLENGEYRIKVEDDEDDSVLDSKYLTEKGKH